MLFTGEIMIYSYICYLQFLVKMRGSRVHSQVYSLSVEIYQPCYSINAATTMLHSWAWCFFSKYPSCFFCTKHLF